MFTEPDNCEGVVTCSVVADPVNDQFSSIIVSLETPKGMRCVEGHEFMLGGETKMVVGNPVSAVFIVDESLGFTYLNQKIYTFDAENRRGAIPCLFNITGEVDTITATMLFVD